MSKPRSKIDHGKIAAKLKTLGLYAGKTKHLEKKDKDRINRAYKKFAYAVKSPDSYAGVKVSPKQAAQWRKRGLTVFDNRVMVYSEGYSNVRANRAGDIFMSSPEKEKRMTLITDPIKLKRLGGQYGNIGFQVKGTSFHTTTLDWESADAYARQFATKYLEREDEDEDDGEKSKKVPLITPVFIRRKKTGSNLQKFIDAAKKKA